MARTNVKSQQSKYSPGERLGQLIPFITEVRIMKRMIGLLMTMGTVVGVVGCGDNNNPVKSDKDLLVGMTGLPVSAHLG